MKPGLLPALFRTLLLGGVVSFSATTAALQDDDPGIRALLHRLEDILLKDDSSGYRDLLAPTMDLEQAEEFAGTELRPGVTRTVIRERGRDHLTGAARGAGYRLVVDAFVESGDRARVATWRLDLKKNGDGEWGIAGVKRLSGVDNVYRLSINSTRQFKASHFKLRSEDFEQRKFGLPDRAAGSRMRHLFHHRPIKYHCYSRP